MLAHNNKNGVNAQPYEETEICKWVADGSGFLIGFTATGSYSAEFKLYVGEEIWYVYSTSPGNRTAYMADRAEKIITGTEVRLVVEHEDSAQQHFKGTILGGK